MRVLVGVGFAAEVEEDVYTATPLTKENDPSSISGMHQTSVSLIQYHVRTRLERVQ